MPSFFPVRLLLPVLLAAAVFMARVPACAQVYTFHTSDSQIRPGTDNQGWWSPTERNLDDNMYYTVGRNEPKKGDFFYLNNFFSFNLSGLDLQSKEIVSATLEVQRFFCFQPTPLTFELHDVTTDVLTLNNNTGASQAIYDDLGQGVRYGSYEMSLQGQRDDIMSFDLNAQALTDIASRSGRDFDNAWFSLGGSVARLPQSGTATLFEGSYSNGPNSVQRLRVTTRDVTAVPEPTAPALMAAGFVPLALAAALLRRRRRGRHLPAVLS